MPQQNKHLKNDLSQFTRQDEMNNGDPQSTKNMSVPVGVNSNNNNKEGTGSNTLSLGHQHDAPNAYGHFNMQFDNTSKA